MNADQCPGGWEAHEAHLDLNGECPWCGTITPALARRLGLDPEAQR